MPRYRLKIQNGFGDTPDDEGGQYPDAAAARREAVAGIRSLVSEEASNGVIDLSGPIDIVADDGLILATVSFAQAIELRGPSSR
jgi:hypothetical protein